MSKIHHDSPDAERLALAWHRLGALLNAASVVVSIVGVAWHFWACKEHERAMKE